MAELMISPDPERPQVMKFGGACFLNLTDYRIVARYIADRLQDSGRVIAVVSAMSGATGNLQAAQRNLHSQPPAALSAALLVTADTVSSILLATALCELNINARAIEASEEGLSAAGAPDRARLTRIDPAPLWRALADREVIVIPGGRAVDENKRTVTLGRNSSDLSAIATAVAVRADCCEIFSDVPGVYTADPYLLPEAQILAEVGYRTARRMSRAGAKVLHPAAIELAERHGLPIVCRIRPPDATAGTEISGSATPAVILADTRTAVWAFSDIAELERVRDRLVRERFDEQGVDHVVVDYDGVRYLAVPGGDSQGTAHRVCAAAHEASGLRLLTTIRGDHDPERVLVPEDELISEARRRHELHYPVKRNRSVKQRSSLSGLLTQSPTQQDPVVDTMGQKRTISLLALQITT
jgi:aspartate kinase